MKKVYVCSPYRGNMKENTAVAKAACRKIMAAGNIPVAPHLYFTRFLDDWMPGERELGLAAGIELLKECDEVCVVGGRVTEGMAREIAVAAAMGKKITHAENPLYPDYVFTLGAVRVMGGLA